MPSQGINLFVRIIARNPKVYLLKVVSLALAFASSTLVILFGMNEFGFDRFHTSAENIYRLTKRNNADDYNGNRFSISIPTKKFETVRKTFGREVAASRVSILNATHLTANGNTLRSETVHAADRNLPDIFSFEVIKGSMHLFRESAGSIIVSKSLAKRLFNSSAVIGKPVAISTDNGQTISLKVSAVYNDFPTNSHETFQAFIQWDSTTLQTLGFSRQETGVYLQTEKIHVAQIEKSLADRSGSVSYNLQPLAEIYFGRRMIGEESKHGDRYSIVILTSITTLILILALTNYVILTTLTLPYRSKEFAVKKLAGTTQEGLLRMFLTESFALVSISVIVGMAVLIFSSALVKPLLGIDVIKLLLAGDLSFIGVCTTTALMVTLAPLFLILKFIRASPSGLLGSTRLTFPRVKKSLMIIQLGVSMLVLVLALVMKRQIHYSLVKEPGRNNDQIVYLDYPSDLTQEGLARLRDGWRSYHPNIVDVLATSHLPQNLGSKEIDSRFYVMTVDPMFPRFFGLNMLEGNWYKPNASDSSIVVNRMAMDLLPEAEKRNVLGVLEDLSVQFNASQKPIKFKYGKAEKYNYLFIRILEVDIRRTVSFLSSTFHNAEVKFLDSKFQQWLTYQDRLNLLSNLLAIIAAILSCFAIYGLALSYVKEKMKELAVHKIHGAGFLSITGMLVKHFSREMALAMLYFTPITYFMTTELLRNFAYATSLQWSDLIIPIVFSMATILCLSAIQAIRLNLRVLVTALKN